ncbi:MAG: amino acid ABC transporter substrate-binding protein [Deltaproteobacteria bacterium]|nr:amino acid ABC transporter substrate-binding protein [Deltaproteobacteria bacterium]
MRKLAFLIVAILTLLLMFTQSEASETVRLVACNFPPYEFEHPDGELRGFDVEVVEEAFQREGITAVFEFYPWARALKMAKDGEVTAVVSCTDTQKRRAFLIMSDIISSSRRVFLVRKDYKGPLLTSFDDLRGLKVGAVKGYISSVSLTKHGIKHDISISDTAALKKLADSRIDVFYTALETIQYLSLNLGMKDSFKWFVYFKKNYHLCFSKKWPDVEKLVSRFNKGLKSIKEDGTYDRIHNKYR